MVSPREAQGPFIPQFYAGRALFITGGTGFMGKVLIERLLSTCPDVDRLFLLLRAKRDLAPEKRLLQLKDSQVFDNIRASCPGQLDKIHAVSGDITLPGLGLTADSISAMRNVSLVFHSAATLKFHESLPRAVDQNLRSVIRVLELCDKLPNMQALIYVSTAYSNSELSAVEERVYAPPAALGSLLALTDAVPEPVLDSITDKLISPKPNTYTFTKAMAEVAVERHGCSYPVAIFRPSIVISAVRHPFPGWVENLNGPTGVVVGAGKGLLHVFRRRADARADMLPVDIAIDTLLAVAWETATVPSPSVRVYNCSTGANPTTWAAFERSLRALVRRHPLDNALWWPWGVGVHNGYDHGPRARSHPLNNALWWPWGVGVHNGFLQKILETLLQTIPLHLAEYTSRLLGIKTSLSLIMVSNRLQAMNSVLQFFSQREWRFATDHVDALRRRLSPADAAIYNLDPNSFKWDEVYENFIKGTKKYVLKEKEENLEEARRHMRRMFYLHYGVILLALALLSRLVLSSPLGEIVRGGMRLLLSVYETITRA